ncbi:FAD:protein FMN transferase [Spirochaetia bacterium]|nr:FAD:protein FMN transferase [Spirochaetia bacterium]
MLRKYFFNRRIIIKRSTITITVLLFLSLLSAVVSAFTFSGCSRTGPSTAGSRTEFALGTICRIDLFESGSPGLYNRLFTRLAELDTILSANREDSELSGINRNAGLSPVPVSPELFTVLERARYFAEASGGAFDPTVGPLVKLWAVGLETPPGSPARSIPQNKEILAALALVHWQDLELVPSASANGGTAFLRRAGMALDLGAIAKGYAADELVKILRETNTPRAIIDLGGNVYVWGSKADGSPWRVGVQNPQEERGNYAGILKLKDTRGSKSVVTSGVYERYFIGSDGSRYHHILDLSAAGHPNQQTRRGYPVENGLLSVTIIAASSMDADALSTACFVLGYEKGLALAAANGAEVLFIFEDTVIRGSAGAMAVFTMNPPE